MKKSLAFLLLLATTATIVGCRHHINTINVLPPPSHPVEKPPVVPLATEGNIPTLAAPASPDVVLGGAVAPAPHKREWRSRADGSSSDAKNNSANAAENAAAGGEPSTATPIGQLSAAPNTQSLPGKTSIEQEINSIQKQLDGIHRALNVSEQKTASQIRTFLAKASNALQAGDLDGAHTLAVKARVLLNELQ